MKFERNVPEIEKLYSKFVNAFQRTGFLNNDLFNMNRDIKDYLFEDVLIDPYTSNKYEEVLIAYKEIPYNERILQNIVMIKKQNENALDIPANMDICASLDIMNVRLYKCIFSKPPIDLNMEKGIEIQEVIEKIEYLRKRGYKIIESVEKFYKSQAKKHKYNVERIIKQSIIEESIADSSVILVIPIPEKNGSYNINGQIRQPFMTEAFYYERAIYGYTPFTFKDRKGKNRNKVRKQTAYFIHDIYTKDGYNKPIFHLKFYAKYFVNALAVFEEKEAEDIVKQIMELDISDEVKDITLNTYECYLMDQEMRKKSGDAIPNIYQWIERSHDVGFNKKRDKMIASGEIDEFLDNSELPEESEDEIFAKNNSFRLDRRMINANTVIKLIAGYSKKHFYALYPHLGEELLRISDTNKSVKEKTSDNTVKYSKAFIKPMSLEIYKTIASNSALFNTFNNTNCFDYNACLQYNKYRYLADTNPNSKDGRDASDALPHERFLKWGVDYGFVDAVTVKSEKSSGTQALVTGLQIHANRIYKKR
jgi:hypothetical protein|uniref:Uncharacterized protein n=1 Tax=Myoviridae sp. ctkfK18 TaxID=2825165 RepID=A0A8S5VGZ7_9CAUD|nr:MAG TPA: hypothetical protein [Myoviridae sp. ctkfK18]